jgi:hypothetical protein
MNCVVFEIEEYHTSPLRFFNGYRKAMKKLKVLLAEIECEQTAMGLPPVVCCCHSFGKM